MSSELGEYKSQIQNLDFKSDGKNDQSDAKAKTLAEAKLDEMYSKLQKGTISQEDFDNFNEKIKILILDQNADVEKINGEFDKAKNEIIKKSAQAIKDGKQETLVTGTFKKLFYFPLGIEENLGKNNEFQNYSKGVIDELMALPEVVELIASNSQARAQLIEAFKNLSWEQIKNSFHISVDNAYEAGRATVFTILMISGIGALLKTGSKLIGKIAKAKPIKPIKPATPTGAPTGAPTGKAAEEASKLKAMGEKPKTAGLADAGTAEVRGILNKGGKLTPDELTKLDTRRALLNKEASTSGVTPKRLEAINKEVNLIESKIRGSQSGMNGAADSARVFDSEIVFGKLSNDVLKGLDISKLGGKEFTQAFENGLTRNYKIVNISGEYKVFVQDAKTSKFVLATEGNGIPKGQARANFDARIGNEMKSGIKPTSQSELLIALDVSKIGGKEFTQAFENGLTRNYKIVNISGEYKVFVQDAKTSKFVLATEGNGIPKGQARANFDARISNEIAQINKKGVASKDILTKNGLLNDADRFTEASKLLGIELTEIQKQTLLRAHNIEQGRNIVKGKILMKDGVFTREQAQLLMDNGIAGRFTDIAKKSSTLLSSPKAITDKINSLLINLKGGEKIVKMKDSIRATIKDISTQLDDAKLVLKEAKNSKNPDLIEPAKLKVDELKTALKESKKALKSPENFIDRPIKYGLITAAIVAAHLERGTRIDASDELLLSEDSYDTIYEPVEAPVTEVPEEEILTDESQEEAQANSKSGDTSTTGSSDAEKKQASDKPKDKYDLSKNSPILDEALKGKEYEVDVKTSLNVRNEKGEIISNMKKGEKVTLTGNKKEANGITFVEIGKDKYVALKYLNALNKPVTSNPSSTDILVTGPSNNPADKVAENQKSFNYDDLRQSIKDYNNNENRFILPEGSKYFGDNFSSERFSGFAIQRGREDFRLRINIDGTFNLLNTTGIEYHDIGEKAKVINTGKITMKEGKFDLSKVLN